MEVEINGKKTTMRLDLGAVRIMNKEGKKNFLTLKDEDFADPEVMAALIYACAVRGNKKIVMDDVNNLTIAELMSIMRDMKNLVGDFLPEPKGGVGEAPLEESRQN